MCIEQSLIDITTHRLTRSVTMRAAFIGGPLLTVAALSINQPSRIGIMFGAFVVTLVVFLVLFSVSKGGIGSGDVRLAPVLAMHLGWLGWQHVYIGLAAGFILGGVWAIGQLATGRATRRSRMAFGPFLCIGAVITLFAL